MVPEAFPEAALVSLLKNLSARGYRWTTPTPETQRRVLARPDRQVAADLSGIFGWSLPFAPEIVEPQLLPLMRSGGIVVEHGNLLANTVRVSSLGDLLFLHSAYPTTEGGAVFFGPDNYRFACFIEAGLAGASEPIRRLVDIGCPQHAVSGVLWTMLSAPALRQAIELGGVIADHLATGLCRHMAKLPLDEIT